MDIESLEKLAQLKEKGILTEEEFNQQKQMLIYKSQAAEGKGINWSNVFLSFLIALLYFVIVMVILGIYSSSTGDESDKAFRNIASVINIITAVFMAMFASSLNSKQYKNCAGPVGAFFGTWLLGPLAVWILVYEFMQIKQGNAVLRPIEVKKKK